MKLDGALVREGVSALLADTAKGFYFVVEARPHLTSEPVELKTRRGQSSADMLTADRRAT